MVASHLGPTLAQYWTSTPQIWWWQTCLGFTWWKAMTPKEHTIKGSPANYIADQRSVLCSNILVWHWQWETQQVQANLKVPMQSWCLWSGQHKKHSNWHWLWQLKGRTQMLPAHHSPWLRMPYSTTSTRYNTYKHGKAQPIATSQRIRGHYHYMLKTQVVLAS